MDICAQSYIYMYIYRERFVCVGGGGGKKKQYDVVKIII